MLPLIARTFFRIQERMLGRRTFAILKELDQSQWYAQELLEELQLRRFQSLVARAYRHTPYWRSVMERSDLTPSDVRSLEDIKRFPFLTKAHVRESGQSMVWMEGGRRIQMARSSGSTNEPIEFYTSAEREAHINAARMRGHESVGIYRGEREMYFWGSPIEISKQDRVKQIRDWLINDGFTSAFSISDESVSRCVRAWLRFRPKCIFCYPSSLAAVIPVAKRQGTNLLELRDRGLEMIITTTEVLGDLRDRLNAAFGVPVYDSYGLREVGLIGHECVSQTMHCVEEQLILETVDPTTLEPTDGEGELVVTNLVGRVMPMIRYRTGDIVTLSTTPCPCGRSQRGISITGGRAVDFLVTSKGLWVSGYTFVYLLKQIPGILKLQAQQERIGHVRLLLVVDETFGMSEEDDVRQYLGKSLQCNDEIEIQRVATIPPCPSGKHRMVISKVAEELRACQGDGSAQERGTSTELGQPERGS